uniref:Uncharacterized protein n=1 Tax=Anguilla anguilla TaxID=7936 RepID=A0A0E9UZZ9_ANGAN
MVMRRRAGTQGDRHAPTTRISVLLFSQHALRGLRCEKKQLATPRVSERS